MKVILILIFFMLFAFVIYAQDQNPRIAYRQGAGLYLMGPNAFGSMAYDYFFMPHLNAEAGIGYIGVHAGLKLHVWGGRDGKSWTPYLGAAIARSLFASVGTDYLPYFPAGINYIGKNGINFALEIAPFQLNFLAWNLGGVKVGYRF